ncbi:hypothetical protein GHT06_019802 [Daphnia sinensis]|uniref:Uncharacterized protein n=1 Tax=Daphnia sinensis TaxID=1820382 RepID=A0AAD5KL93_9CRUS|nr:hypothetical protein GHT06_019802 [Daphnia sinensis]
MAIAHRRPCGIIFRYCFGLQGVMEKDHFLLREGCGAIYVQEEHFSFAIRTDVCGFGIHPASFSFRQAHALNNFQVVPWKEEGIWVSVHFNH